MFKKICLHQFVFALALVMLVQTKVFADVSYVNIKSVGHGDTYESALNKALVEALQKVNGVSLKSLKLSDTISRSVMKGSDKEVYKDQLFRNQIYKETEGAIKSFEIIQEGVEAVIFLTATPVRNYPINLWNLLHWTDPQYWSKKEKANYTKRYCNPSIGYQGRLVYTGASNLEELHMRVQPFLLYKSLDEILPYLPKINNTIYSMKCNDEVFEQESSEIQKIMDEHGWELDDLIDNETLDAEQVKILMRIEELSKTAYTHKRKTIIEDIDRHLSETEEQVVLVATHKAVIDDLKLKYHAESIDGRVPSHHRQAIVDRFNAKERRVIVLQSIAGGVGFSIPDCNRMKFVEIGYSARDIEQLQGRIRRLTSTRDKAFYDFFVLEDTIDQKMLEATSRKSRVSSMVVTGAEKDIFDSEITNYEKLDID